MDAAIVAGMLTQVKDNKVTLSDEDGTTTYDTELTEFKDQDWVTMHLGMRLQCKVVDGVIVQVD